MGIASSVIKPFAGVFNRARLGFPRHYFDGTGGVGDDLMCTAVFRELKKRGAGRIVITTRYAGLFVGNRDVDGIVYHSNPRLTRWLRKGLPFVRLGYADYIPERDADEPPNEHVLVKMSRLAGITGAVELRPYVFLDPTELESGQLAKKQVVIQSSILGSLHPMRNKEWYPQRFQEACAQLPADVTVIQLGAAGDPKIEGAIDRRGNISFRLAAAILANSLVFIGLEGFLMHLARAVDCRSVIVYGGRIKPSQIGYVANENLYSPVTCAPCWLRNHCDYDRKCMDMITVEQVIAGAREQIRKHGTPLEVETAEIKSET